MLIVCTLIKKYYLYNMNKATNILQGRPTLAQMKTKLEFETGVKTTVKRIKKGSMKGYAYFTPKKFRGEYPQFPFSYCQANANSIDFYNVSNIMIFAPSQVLND